MILSIGLLAGGAFAAYRYIAAHKERRHSESHGDMGGPADMGRVVASCLHRDVKDEDDVSSGKYESAITRSRDLLQRAKDEFGAPGIVAAVSVDGKLVWSEGIGYADVENRTPCLPSSVFRIASISKSLTMTAVAKLWEEGKLDLDKPVQEYVPSFPEKEWVGEKVALTTRNLVSHLGGIRHYDKSYMKKNKDEEKNKVESKDKDDKNNTQKKLTSTEPVKSNKNTSSEKEEERSREKTPAGNTVMKREADFSEMKSKKEFKSVTTSLDLFKDDPFVHKPGTEYLYTTHGWTLISAVVEGSSGKDYLTYMRLMLADLGLKETVPDKHVPIIYNRARGYRYNKNGRLENCPYVDLSYKWAGGGYLSTVGDLIKFGNAMLYSYQQNTNLQGQQEKTLPGYLKQETVQAIWKPIPTARAKPTNEYCYAMGWTVVEKEQQHGHCRPHRHFVAHSGGAMGFSSMLTIAPSQKADIDGCNDRASVLENKDIKRVSLNATNPPKGVVVALYVNLLDVGLSKTAEGIIEAFRTSMKND